METQATALGAPRELQKTEKKLLIILRHISSLGIFREWCRYKLE